MSIFAKLAADEIAALAVPLQNVCSTIAAGDGSVASVVGQGVVLQGALISLAPQLQKVGVNDFFTALGKLITDEAAKAQAALNPVPAVAASAS